MPDNPILDTTLFLERLRENPHEAFEELVRLYQTDVRILTRRHLGRSQSADEVAQEVFVAIYHGLPNFRGDGSLRAWIFGITINQIRSFIRTQSRTNRLQVISPELLESTVELDVSDPFISENAELELTALEDCVDRLEPKHREIIRAFYFQKQSAELIGERLGQKSGAVRMMMMRIRQRLGKCIRKKLTWRGTRDES